MNKITRLAMVGIASVGLMATMNSGASAAPEINAGPAAVQDWGGGWSDVRDVSIREKPSTTARKVGTLKKGKIVKCWVAGCSGTHNGGAYKCTSSSPTEKDWHEVQWNGKKAWAASRCLEWGRVE
ncbi:SH3 domain-containing protein [Streptomyces sp. NPDC012466]|uniref:SH3 domain-containing protein n=1 Tax=Streptomyces sp. NPDC012466 TaxID=3364835 RepID=UPI0036F13622